MPIDNGGGPKRPPGDSRRGFVRGLAVGGSALLTPGLLRAATLAGGAMALQNASARPFAAMEALKAQDPEVHAAASNVLAYLKLTMAATAAGRAPAGGTGAGNPFADSARAFIASRPAKRRAVYRDASAGLLSASAAERATHFGALAAVDPGVALASPARALSPVRRPIPMLRKRLDWIAGVNVLGADGPPDKDPPAQKNPDRVAGEAYKHLEFAVNYVRCLEGTGGLLEGTDEILAGGMVVGATGVRRKVKPWFVGENFGTDSDDRHTKSYWDWGGYHFAFFNVDVREQSGDEYPHYYLAQVALSEQDDGGFGDFLASIWDKVGTELSQALGEAAGTAIGASLGSAIPGLGTVIGVVIGALVSWLVSLFHNEDDKIGVDHATLKLTSWKKSYYDGLGLTTAQGHVGHVMNFTDAGHYHVGYRWRLYDEAGYQARQKTLKQFQPAYLLGQIGASED